MTVKQRRARRLTRALTLAALAASASPGLSAASALAAGESATAPPTISGEPVLGQTLHATHASWSGTPTSFQEWWMRCDSAGQVCNAIIAGADSLDYTPTSADVGHALEFGEFAYDGNQRSEPAYSSSTDVVLATPPRHFTLVGPTGIPQFVLYLVEPAGKRPTARSWRKAIRARTVGHVDADVNPGQTIYFSPTAVVGARAGSIAHTRTPEGPGGKAYHVTASTPSRVRVVMPSAGRPFHPELSRAELYVLGQLNRKRRRLGEPALRVSTILDKVASVAAHDEATHGRFPDSFLFSLAPSFGWPGDLTERGLAIVDAPLIQPADVLAHWDGKYTGESTALWDQIKAPFYLDVGIADGGGAWNIVLTAGCPVATGAKRACGLTNITGM